MFLYLSINMCTGMKGSKETLTFHQKKHFDESDPTPFCMSHKLSDVWRLVEKYCLLLEIYLSSKASTALHVVDTHIIIWLVFPSCCPACVWVYHSAALLLINGIKCYFFPHHLIIIVFSIVCIKDLIYIQD